MQKRQARRNFSFTLTFCHHTLKYSLRLAKQCVTKQLVDTESGKANGRAGKEKKKLYKSTKGSNATRYEAELLVLTVYEIKLQKVKQGSLAAQTLYCVVA